MPSSRGSSLHRVGAAAGGGAVYSAMVALGLMATPPAAAGPLQLPATLGRGMAGLVCAYELEREGWAAAALEAQRRLGGRYWTLRVGSKINTVGGADQTVRFSDGFYVNAGPREFPAAMKACSAIAAGSERRSRSR